MCVQSVPPFGRNTEAKAFTSLNIVLISDQSAIGRRGTPFPTYRKWFKGSSPPQIVCRRRRTVSERYENGMCVLTV